MRWAAFAVLALLAGCLSDPEPEAAPEPTSDGGPQEPLAPAAATRVLDADGKLLRETFRSDGHMNTEAASWVSGPMDSEGWRLDFTALEGATAIVIEVAWNDTLQDLDAFAGAPSDCFDRHPFPESATVCLVDVFQADGSNGAWWNKEGSIGRGDSPSRIVIEGDLLAAGGPGTWISYAWAKDATNDLDFHLFATVLYDGTDPSTFTAIPWV